VDGLEVRRSLEVGGTLPDLDLVVETELLRGPEAVSEKTVTRMTALKTHFESPD
jgi:hypothetical protein